MLKRGVLALGELEAAAGARLAVLLALDGAGIAGEEAGLLEGRTELGVEVAQRAGEPVADGTRLAVNGVADADALGGRSVLRWTTELRPVTSCAAIAELSAVLSCAIVAPLPRNERSAGFSLRPPLPNPVQSVLVP